MQNCSWSNSGTSSTHISSQNDFPESWTRYEELSRPVILTASPSGRRRTAGWWVRAWLSSHMWRMRGGPSWTPGTTSYKCSDNSVTVLMSSLGSWSKTWKHVLAMSDTLYNMSFLEATPPWCVSVSARIMYIDCTERLQRHNSPSVWP